MEFGSSSEDEPPPAKGALATPLRPSSSPCIAWFAWYYKMARERRYIYISTSPPVLFLLDQSRKRRRVKSSSKGRDVAASSKPFKKSELVKGVRVLAPHFVDGDKFYAATIQR